MVAAAITSVIGAAYTSVSFIHSFHPALQRHANRVIIGFIVVSTVVFLFLGQPVRLLILAGAVNGLILPLTLGTILLAAHKRQVMGPVYRHPVLLTLFGLVVVLAMAWMGGLTLFRQLPLLFAD